MRSSRAQQQMKITWPASSAVALAYVDQLTRSKGLQPERARAVKTALDRADGLRSGQDKNAGPVLDQLDAIAKQLESDAGTTATPDAGRLKALAAAIRSRASKLR